jgi:hypothetical protein
MTIEDLFLTGAGRGIAGSILLAIGLFPSRQDIEKQSATFWGRNPYLIRAMGQNKAAGEIGLLALAVAFVLEVVGTLAEIGARQPSHLIIGLALVAAGILLPLGIYYALRGRLQRWTTLGEGDKTDPPC